MKLVILCSLLLPTVLSTAFGSNSAVITAQDVKEGLNATKISLQSGGKYRVYAVYAASAPNVNYAKNVVIKGADNAKFNVADLAKPKSYGYVLDESKILTAPITISDTNSASATRVPYTIYVVSANYPVAPVVSAQFANGKIDASAANLNSPSCTILSAEKSIQLNNFYFASAASLDVKTGGFDSIKDDYTVLTLTPEAVGSFATISGPIVTLHNPKGTPANFGFVVKREGSWSDSITSGASTTLLSNGFLNLWESYSVDYANDNALTRNYIFAAETQVWFNPAVGNYYPDSEDSEVKDSEVKFTCVKANGKSTVYDLGKLAGSVQNDFCKSFVLNVSNGKQTATGPRFVVEVATGPKGFPW